MPGVSRRDRRPPRLGNASNQRVTQVVDTSGALAICSETSRCGGGRRVEIQDPVGEVFLHNLFEGPLESELRANGTAWGMGSGWATSYASGATTGIEVAGFTTGDQSMLTSDPDSDGLPTWRELARGTDPLNADTNANGLTDLVELDVPAAGAHADEDGDGLASAAEIAKGTDPFLADTDGDGFNDRVDAFPLDPTRHDPLAPTPGDVTPPVITLTEPTNAVPLP